MDKQKLEARREAKRLQKELERIEKEKKPKTSKVYCHHDRVEKIENVG